MSITWTYEDGDPADREVTPEWRARWEAITSHLVAEAERLGGSAAVRELAFVLTPPPDGRGEVMTVEVLERGAAHVIVGGISFSASWYLTDRPEDRRTVDNIVTTLMNTKTSMYVRLNPSSEDPGLDLAQGAGYLSPWARSRPAEVNGDDRERPGP